MPGSFYFQMQKRVIHLKTVDFSVFVAEKYIQSTKLHYIIFFKHFQLTFSFLLHAFINRIIFLCF